MIDYSGRRLIRSFAFALCLAVIPAVAHAADLSPALEAPPPAAVTEAPNGWTFRFIPYAGS
jgi:hypothetical protein